MTRTDAEIIEELARPEAEAEAHDALTDTWAYSTAKGDHYYTRERQTADIARIATTLRKLVDERDRYLAALLAEAIIRARRLGKFNIEIDAADEVYMTLGGVDFRVTRNEAGELVAEEVTP